MAQILVPVADQAVGSWSTAPLWSKVDDDSTVSPTGDGTTISSDAVGNNTQTTFADLQLASGSTPQAGSHVLRARWNHNQSGRTMRATCELWQGVPGSGTLVATLQVDPDVGTTETESTYTLTSGEVSNISDYSALYVRLHGFGTGGGPSRNLIVDLVELEIPDAGASPVVIQASPATMSAGAQAATPSLSALAVQAAAASMSPAAQVVSPQVGSGSNLPVTRQLTYHYDADAITGLTDTDPVSQWDDESGNGWHLTQGTATRQPIYRTGVINGLPVVRFDGSDDLLENSAAPTLDQPFTVFAVAVSTRTDTAEQSMVSNVAGQLVIISPRYTTATAVRLYAGTFLTGTTSDISAHRFRWTADSTSSLIHVDGTQEASGDAGTRSLTSIRVGAQDATSRLFQGDIGEIIVYDDLLTAQEITDVEDYLNTKWFGSAGVTIQASPAGLTVGAQPASPSLSALTIPATPATLSPAAQSVNPAPAAKAVQAAPAGMTIGPQASSPALAALAVQAVAAVLTPTAQATNPSLAALSIQASPGNLVTTAQTVDAVLAALAIQASPGNLALDPRVVNPIVSGAPVTIQASPGALTLTGQPTDPVLAALAIQAIPAGLQIEAQSLDPILAALTVQVTPAGLAIVAQATDPQAGGVTVQAAPANLSTFAQTVDLVLAALAVQASPAGLVVTAQVLSAAAAVEGEVPVITAVGKFADLSAVGRFEELTASGAFVEPRAKGSVA